MQRNGGDQLALVGHRWRLSHQAGNDEPRRAADACGHTRLDAP